MCGIVGVFLTANACDSAIVDRMCDLLSHRGPDDRGSHIDGALGLGHRRLSIIDLESGHQPMSTPDGRLTVVFNGEIYNYRELRRELESAGAVFRTHSDTEVILHLHARHGSARIDKLNGIFAYALWDSASRTLLLARDRAGIKPLYYSQSRDGFAFASEIKSLFLSGHVAATPARDRIAEYLLFRQVAGPETLFQGVYSLQPGHTLEVIDGQAAEPTGYWTPGDWKPSFLGSFHDAVDALDRTLAAAVARQMFSDVPLGTFCSGGIDSSLVTALAAKSSPGSINTYSVGFDDSDYDESHFARLASAHCGTTHHELRVSESEFVEALPRLVWHHDLPLNFANSVHIYAVSRLARKDVTVVLTGEGADELFGGYPRYYFPRALAPLAAAPRFIRRGLASIFRMVPDHRFHKLAGFAEREPDEWMLFNNATADPDSVATLLNSSSLSAFARRTALLDSVARESPDRVTALAALDFYTHLLSILDRQDKMSMATSIEARVPFLDNDVIDFSRTLPLHYKQTLRHRKRVLKAVALRYLPPEIVYRRKSGFGVPLPRWLATRGPMGRLLDSACELAPRFGVVDVAQLRLLVNQHRSGSHDHSDLLWPIINLSCWWQSFGLD